MEVKEIEKRVLEAFSNCQVAVFDMTGIGESFEIRLSTPDLSDEPRVSRHQKVMSLFDNELKAGEIHALTIKYLS